MSHPSMPRSVVLPAFIVTRQKTRGQVFFPRRPPAPPCTPFFPHWLAPIRERYAGDSKGAKNLSPPLRVLLLTATRSQSKKPFSGLLVPVFPAGGLCLSCLFLKLLNETYCTVMLGKGRTTSNGHSSRFFIMGKRLPCRQGQDKCCAPLTTLSYFTKTSSCVSLDTLETIQGKYILWDSRLCNSEHLFS
jgi:hypothetical protein